MNLQEQKLCLALQGILTRIEAIESSGRMLSLLDEGDFFGRPDWMEKSGTARNRIGLSAGINHQAEKIHDLIEEIEETFGIQMYDADSAQPVALGAGRGHAN